MLYSIDSGKYVKSIPHEKDFERWCKNLSTDDLQNAVDAINEKIDANEVNTAGWMPGSDWTGTPFDPLYEACGRNQTQAGMFFGLLVFNTLLQRDDRVWGFGRFEKDGVPIQSMTYFVIENPPPMD